MLPGAIPVIAEPGDVVLHSPNVLHGSRVTRDRTLRRVNYFAFFTLLRCDRSDEYSAGHLAEEVAGHNLVTVG